MPAIVAFSCVVDGDGCAMVMVSPGWNPFTDASVALVGVDAAASVVLSVGTVVEAMLAWSTWTVMLLPLVPSCCAVTSRVGLLPPRRIVDPAGYPLVRAAAKVTVLPL